ncbi:Antigen 43 [Achromobacter veterisilvae]|uniref:Antigen 43 n=2 Tax=Achromobacter veterisilvae TaxID=2069367 RepID=A0A446CJW9_9BURK|nr:Antigen 43 [Achromobacter veterisilvae]
MKTVIPSIRLKPITAACMLAMSPIAAHAQALSVTDGQTHVLPVDTNLSTSADATAGFGMLVRNANSVVEADGLTISTSGQGAAGIKLESMGKAVMTGGSIQTTTTAGNSSSAAYGVWVTGKGLAELYGTSVSTSGAFAYGLYAYTDPAPAQVGIVAHDVTVTTTGASAHGAVAASKAAMELARATIATTGDGARAVSAQRGTISVSDSTLTTSGANAPGLMIAGDGSGIGSSATVSNTRVETRGSLSSGVKVEGASALQFSGGTIETKALDGNGSLSAFGVWVTGGSHAVLDSTAVKTAGAYAYGLFSTYAPTVAAASIDAINTSVETSGLNAHGVFAHTKSVVNFALGDIKTSGNGATGARAEAGGALRMDGGAITTLGNNAAGLMATANASGVKATAVANNVDIVTHGDVAAGVAAFQQGSTVTLTGGSVETHGAKSNGLSAEATATVNADGTRISTRGATAYGARAYYNGAINLQNAIVATHGAGASGLYANASSSIDATESTITTDGPAAAGVELLSAGSVTLNQTRVSASGAGSQGILSSFADNTVSMTDSAVQAAGSALEVAAGSLQASLNRSALIGVNGVALNVIGRLDMVADDRSYISGAALTDPGTGVSHLRLAGASRWDVTGSSSLTSLSNAASHIDFAPPANPADAAQYKTLTVGNYAGAGGSIALNTWLGGSGSASDKVVIDGGQASGTTSIVVRNTGGGGALTTGDGIAVVETVNGGTSDAASFSLAGRAAAGAYEYRLYRGGSANPDAWYLRSSLETDPDQGGGETGRPAPEYRVEVPLNMALPSLANHFGLAMLGTYHDRNGEDYADAAPAQPHGRSAWGRVFGETGSAGKRGYDALVRQGPAYDYDIAGVQVGTDLYRREQPSGTRDIAGVYVGAATASADVRAPAEGRAGSASMSGISLGGYWTRKSASGAYVDGVVQGTYHPDVKTRSVGGERSTSRGYGGAASIEAGYPIPLTAQWALEPQAQMIYQYVSLDSAKDSYGRVRFDDTHTGHARVGARLTHQAGNPKGEEATTWLRANLWQRFGANGRTTFSNLSGENPVAMETKLGSTWAQVGVGVSGRVSKRVNVFAAGDYNRSIDGYAGHGVSGRLGVRVVW